MTATAAPVHPFPGPEAPVPATGPARALVRAIGWYRAATAGRISGCRYVPSCSAYAAEAIAVHGAVRGSVLAARRLSRCHPLGGHGVDPVPDRRA